MKNEIVFTIFNANTYFHLILETDNDNGPETDRMSTEEVGNEMDKIGSEAVMSSSSKEETKRKQSIQIMFYLINMFTICTMNEKRNSFYYLQC